MVASATSGRRSIDQESGVEHPQAVLHVSDDRVVAVVVPGDSVVARHVPGNVGREDVVDFARGRRLGRAGSERGGVGRAGPRRLRVASGSPCGDGRSVTEQCHVLGSGGGETPGWRHAGTERMVLQSPLFVRLARRVAASTRRTHRVCYRGAMRGRGGWTKFRTSTRSTRPVADSGPAPARRRGDARRDRRP